MDRVSRATGRDRACHPTHHRDMLPILTIGRKGRQAHWEKVSNEKFYKLIIVLIKITFVVLLCGSSYLAGSLLGRHSLDLSIDTQMSVGGLVRRVAENDEEARAFDCHDKLELQAREELDRHRQQLLSADISPEAISKLQTKRFPDSMERFAVGIGRVKKDDLDAFFDFGNPFTSGAGTGEEDALILYHHKRSMPTSNKSLAHAVEYDSGLGIPLMDPQTATENCDSMNVIVTGNPENSAQCTAIIGNYESYHIQRWMRSDGGPINSNLPLTHVSRGLAPRGKSNFFAPLFDGKKSEIKKHWKMLLTFLQNVDSVLNDLKPILKKVSRNNAVVVMTCNYGQSSLLMNFVCSARRKGLDLENVLVFPSDKETKDLAESLGLTTYYDEQNIGVLPSGEARRYGDRFFTAMMYAKVLCVLYPLLLDYDVLFQDVDIIYFKDPLPFFQNDTSKLSHFDVLFQHDGSNTVRYAPYSANTGFYYVRANKRSQYLFTSLLYHSDLIIAWNSHQQVLVQLLAEHSSLFGLNVKVFSKDTDMFPGGYHFHRNRQFMKKMFQGEVDPYIFHMSWTANKDNKLLFFRQMGEWYLNDKCVGRTAGEILGDEDVANQHAPLEQHCCSLEPIFSCHYKDKPSKLPCIDSPVIDQHGISFW